MQASAPIEANFQQYGRILEQLAIIILSNHGEVQMMTQRSWQLLQHYFPIPFNTSNPLPHYLQRWLKHQISLLQTENASCQPLQIELSHKQLSIRLVSEHPGDYYLVLLEEQPSPEFSVTALELLGLTKREAEVLFGVVQGKTTLEIAHMLRISAGTVKKHLEHIYKKFDVQTRAAVLIHTFTRLGMLN
jgi:DNA-binding CsgD family transcriptional regulator